MIITYHGHSMFEIEFSNGETLLMDPYDDEIGYPLPQVYPDYITVSHQHHDHNNTKAYLENRSGVKSQVFDNEGKYTLSENLELSLYPTFHDSQKGALRGENLLTLIEAEGVRILHLGDLGETLEEDFLNGLGKINILLVPVGGYYTIDAKEAVRLIDLLKPNIVIPMHYQTAYSKPLPIAPIEDFLNLQNRGKEELNLLRVTKDDLSEQPSLAILKVFADI